MKEDVLLEYTRQAGFQTGALLAYYNLSGSVDTEDAVDRDKYYKTSGIYNVVFNQLHNSDTQFIDTGDGNPIIANDNYPAMILSQSNAITGSGHFDGMSLLGGVHKMTGESWTCFLDFSGQYSEASSSSSSRVLVSTMSGDGSLSGFHVGLNGSNRLYYEYVAGTAGSHDDSSGYEYYDRTVETLPKHINRSNVISIAKNPNNIEVSLHKPDEDTVSIKSPLVNFTDSHDLFFGGFMPVNDYVGPASADAYRHNYTGFSGYINTILLYDEYMTETSRDIVAESFYLDSYTPEGLVTGERITKEVTGVRVESQAIGYEVTGYEYVQSGVQKDYYGRDIPNYVKSGVEGFLYKEVLVDLTGDANISSITGVYSESSSIRNSDYVSGVRSIPGSIIFSNPISNTEVVEIYSHTGPPLPINYNTDSIYKFATIDLNNDSSKRHEFEVRGFEIKNDKFSYNDADKQPFMQAFRNGRIIQEVSGLHSVSDIFLNQSALKEVGDILGTYKGNFFINDNNAGTEGSLATYPLDDRIENDKYQIVLNSQSDNFSSSDILLYDLIDGASLTGYYPGSDTHFTGDYLRKDIYANGLKIVSGTDYIQSTTAGKTSYLLQSSSLGDDPMDLLFVPQPSDKFSQTTYTSADGSTFSVPNIFNEQVWRNGLRQMPGVDYVKAPEDSLLGVSPASAEKNTFVFNNAGVSLDISIEDSPAALEGARAKIFSYNSEADKNLFSGQS